MFVLLYFAATLFTSATLLFLVQPMIGKMILPRLGGTPAVWNTCMVFFQAVLLLGYGYTHFVGKLPKRRQFVVQGVLLLMPLAMLPFSLGEWMPPADSNPAVSLLVVLAAVVGVPFFVVSTTAPLLQKWFSLTGHPSSRDPYFLYGASNLGSMLALALYPVAIEPNFSLEPQTWIWTAGYGVFAILVLGCIAITWARAAASRGMAVAAGGPIVCDLAGPIAWPRRLRWVALAAVPSSLMLGCTTYMTTDIAAIPFFWVLPLALYLLTFVLVFARWPVVWTASVGGLHGFVLFVQPFFLLALVFVLVAPTIDMPTWLEFTIHLLAFFFTALTCHGELAADRPPTEHLTEFYLCMSIGGVAGGLFNAILAPLVFRWGVFEYPLAMVASCFLRPDRTGATPLIPGDSRKGHPTVIGHALNVVLPVVLAADAWLAIDCGDRFGYKALLMAAPIVGVLLLARRPIRFGLALALVWLTVAYFESGEENWIFCDRGFFGVVKVRRVAVRELGRISVYDTLVHGGIDHGRQHVDPRRRHEPCAYFHPLTGIGQLFMKLSWPDTELPKSFDEFAKPNNPYRKFTLPNWRMPASLVGLGTDPLSELVALHGEPPFAVVGLGAGTLAAFAKPYQHVDFYEIDPLVLKLSQKNGESPPTFRYLTDAEARGANVEVILGDGRKMIEKAPEQWYHVICLDAFASDAIPVHLLTVEAIKTYLDKLAPGGVLVFNTTNRYVDVGGVLKQAADHLDLECIGLRDGRGEELVPEKYRTEFVMLRRSQKAIDALGTAYNGGPSLRTRFDEENWKSLMTDMANKHETMTGRTLNWRPWQAPADRDGELWTDRYSNLLGVLRFRP